MWPNWECDTDKAKVSAKLGLKASAAALTATAYWALGLLVPGPLALWDNLAAATDRVQGQLARGAARSGGGVAGQEAGQEAAAVGLGSASKVGAGKNNMNSGEGHELNGSMDTHEEEGCRRLCSIEISA